jgi:ABC-type oligopeptide transport system substrate-binding subunit
MRKFLFIIAVSFCFLFGSVNVEAMGSRGNNPRNVTNPGPRLKFTSEGALSFYIDIIGVTDEPLDYEPVTPNETSIALGEFNLVDGLYEVDIHGDNLSGKSQTLTFDLQVKSDKNTRTYTIIPIKELADKDPEYMKSFSTTGLSITVPKTIRIK